MMLSRSSLSHDGCVEGRDLIDLVIVDTAKWQMQAIGIE